MKRTILITASTYPRWDGDNTPAFVKQFAEELAARGDNPIVLAPHAPGAKTYEVNAGVRVRRYRYFFPSKSQNVAYEGGAVNKIKKTPLYALKVTALIGSLFIHTLIYAISKRADVLNPHWVVPQGFAAVLVKFLTGKRVVLTVHGGDIFNLTGKTMTKIKRFVLKHCDEVCPNSEATMLGCKAIYDRDYKIIPMGIYMEKFHRVDPVKALQEKYELSDVTILFAGRLAEVKGVRYLLEAAKQLVDNGMNFKLLIVGDGPLKSDFQSYINTNHLERYVTLVGWIDASELNDYYGIADVFVGPSLSEPQGLVFVEALASSTPVIASNVGGIVDIVSNGVNGYLVEPKSSQAIADKLQYLMRHREVLKKFSDNARQSVENRFSWENTAEQYSNLFKEQMS